MNSLFAAPGGGPTEMSGRWLIRAAGYYGVPTGKNGVAKMASLRPRIGAQITRKYAHNLLIGVYARSRPNQITGLDPKSGPARKSESRGPENGVSRWRRPNSDIYSHYHFGLVYDVI